MKLSELKYKSSKTLHQELIDFRSIDDFQVPFQARNGFDMDPPYLFIQHAKYIEIWDMGYYTDYELTWIRGIGHFAYTINQLLGGNTLEIVNLKDNNKKIMMHDIDQFQYEWLSHNEEYKRLIDNIIEFGRLHF